MLILGVEGIVIFLINSVGMYWATWALVVFYNEFPQGELVLTYNQNVHLSKSLSSLYFFSILIYLKTEDFLDASNCTSRFLHLVFSLTDIAEFK